MLINRDSNGQPIGFIETFVSNKEVVTVNATTSATTIVTHDRESGKVETQIYYGQTLW